MSIRIAIVGGGFSGTVLAANLLRQPPSVASEILLIERGAQVGRGLAYALHDCPYLLNVPAGRLSADSADPDQFLRFAQRSLPGADAEDFLPRRLYGDYLQDLLARAEDGAAAHVRLRRLKADVTSLTPASNGTLTLHLADAPLLARTLIVEHVVLAVGNPPPLELPPAAPVLGHPAYHADPWKPPAHLTAADTVLIIGNGLTMADVVLSLSHDVERAPRMLTLSRRGLTPLRQSSFHAAALRGGPEFFDGLITARGLLAACRDLARDVERLGGDWREAVTFVRGAAPAIWQRLTAAERSRFLRHLQVYWDVHRHRMPPALAAHLGELTRRGRLIVQAGRLLRLEPDGRGLRATWRSRGSADTRTLHVDAVVNATGPDYALRRTRNRLLASLAAAGSISSDAHELGLRTTAQGACVGADGQASRNLYYLGPMLRADHWEATAATELRNHAERLARHLAGVDSAAGSRGGAPAGGTRIDAG